ncbi:MAG: hypothetical protein WC526_02790 [Patescibacteria group bacterium]
MYKKGLIWIVVLLIIVAGLVVGKIFLNKQTPISTSPTPTTSTQEGTPDAWNTYASTKDGYKISYPPEFNLKDDNIFLVDHNATGTEIDFPSTYTTGTNLREAYVGITNRKVATPADCYASFNGGENSSSTVTINGITFNKIDESGAGAGNYYEDVRYAVVKGDSCYNVALFMHSVQRLNYPEETRPAEFDRAAVTNIFDEIMKTFSLL